MATNSSKSRFTSHDLKWFDSSKYDLAKSWGIADWVGAIGLRYMLKGVIKPGQGLSGHEQSEGERILLRLLVDPAPHGGGATGGMLAKGYARVWDKTVIDVFDDWGTLNRDEVTHAREACDAWYAQIDLDGAVPDLPPLLNQGFADWKRKVWPRALNYEQIYVDLHVSDIQLVEDFRSWLAKKREALKTFAPKKPVSSADMHDWWRFRVLAFIDLQLYCHYMDAAISQATMGALLFPEEMDVDLTERVRKVVKPMAEMIMTSDFLSAIDDQASRPE